MNIKVSLNESSSDSLQIILVNDSTTFSSFGFSQDEILFINSELEKNESFLNCYQTSRYLFIKTSALPTSFEKKKEKLRILGHQALKKVAELKINKVDLLENNLQKDELICFVQGFLLSNYSFDKYKKEKDFKVVALNINTTNLSTESLQQELNLIDAVYTTRDLVNEPPNKLTSSTFSQHVKEAFHDSQIKIDIWGKGKIEAEKMGGLLAVNQGSVEEPKFIILEYKPGNAVNEKPIVFVGKGVMYDTGGLSLKPTPNSMDIMKCDMGGAATVLGAFQAISKNELPYHIITLIPCTDNILSAKSYAPGDVITMHSGHTVEVGNTDAEGRLILADALSFAKKYEPELVIDFATLTGSALHAIGHLGSVFMGTASDKIKDSFISSGKETHERLVEFPFWDEYKDSLKSEVADLKNIGAPQAGAITAGKFLEHFIAYEWLHFDIAGTAFIPQAQHYNSKDATGIGVRLIYDFIDNYKQK